MGWGRKSKESKPKVIDKMSKILVSLVSEQTIPNVEFIKEMEDQIDYFLFITTKSMVLRIGCSNILVLTWKLQNGLENKV